jgi:hypothetical protein
VADEDRLPNEAALLDLVEQKRGNLLRGNPSKDDVCDARFDPQRSGRRTVAERRRPNDGPVRSTLSDQRFLAIFVCVDAFREQWVENPVVHEPAVTFRFARAYACYADQSPHALALHVIEQDVRPRRYVDGNGAPCLTRPPVASAATSSTSQLPVEW